MKFHGSTIIETIKKGVGKDTVYQWVKDNLCLNLSENGACNECRSCKSFETGNHPDFIKVIKLSDKKNISVEQVRDDILRKVNSKPLLSKTLIVLIEEAEALSIGAENALLKKLEEPEDYLKILLLVDREGKLLPTIRSRCQVISLQEETSQKELSDFELLKQIINSDLPARFALAKQITDKDKEEERKDSMNTLSFIDQLTEEIRSLLKNELDNEALVEQALKDLQKILEDRQKILYNTNKLLVLENILLQTVPRKVYEEAVQNIQK